RVRTVAPGVDLDIFRPGQRSEALRRLGLAGDAVLLLFVGRIQPLKAPDVLLRAAARLVELDPELAQRLQVVIVGAPSGSGVNDPLALSRLASELGIADRVRFEPPASRTRLADFYAAADLTVVPSHNESFGLVALESQACGVPVVAAAVGGLRTAVLDGRTGALVGSHRTEDWADVLGGLLGAPQRRAGLGVAARRHAEQFSWRHTADGLLVAYRDAVADFGSLALTGSDSR
ncbi:MAG: D-inositol-3-phosphate glycosyltransferase, partial [Pseudonocardiales bacterium]|nr:D-inositol-3-phosphate glycosyltransferase [Pseudonocardiales bacterium]